MYRLWIYVFCSVAVGVRSSLGELNSSLGELNSSLGELNSSFGELNSSFGELNKTEVVPPSKENFYTGVEETLITGLPNVAGNVLLGIHKPVSEFFNLKRGANPFLHILPNYSSEVCFEDLGCFPMNAPWKTLLRPIGKPSNPIEINATISFFSRENLMQPKTVSLYPKLNLEQIPFSPKRVSVFIVHGFTASGFADWVQKMKSTYLSVMDVNVLVLDWAQGAQRRNYFNVAANTRVVGKEMALLIKKLIKDHGAKAKNFHLIGHSLGSHVCSYAAKEVRGIGRLTALDPAQPGFEGFNRKVRLDKTDAKFVEVFHTDARPFIPAAGFGMIAPHGHVDFYFNGGFGQPGCLFPKVRLPNLTLESLGKFPVDVLAEFLICPHSRAYEYFIESLNTSMCTFWGQKIDLFNSLQSTTNALTQGLITLPRFEKCSPNKCIPLGLSSVNSTFRGSFLVTTRNSSPYCKE